MNTLKFLSKDHEITYAVIIPYTNSNFTRQELSDFCLTQGIRFAPFELKYRFRDPRLISVYSSIVGAIRKANPDLVYFANFDQLYLNALLLGLNPAKTIIGMHDVESHSGTAFAFLASLSKRILIARFRYFHTYSTLQQKILLDRAPEKVVYNIPLPLLGFGALPPNEADEPSDCVNFLFFGFILSYKGLDLLISAFRRVAARHDNAQLTIAGRCQDWEEQYAALVKDCPQIVAHIRFIENAEIPEFFSAADYLVLPYRDTTQSGPLMIAYHYNVPVLVSDAEGFSEFTEEGVTGYRFELHRVGDMERVLEECVKATESDYVRLKEKLADFTHANFSTEVMVRKYNTMFADVEGSTNQAYRQ